MRNPAVTVTADALMAAFESIGAPVALIDEGGRIVFANAALCEAAGRSAAELLALPHFSAALAIEERAPESLHHRDIRAEAGEMSFDSVIVRPDGREVRLGGDVAFVETEAGRLLLMVARDLSDHARRDALLGRYAAVCQRMPMGVLILQFTGDAELPGLELVAANPAASDLTGMDLSGRTGARLDGLLGYESGGALQARLAPLRGTSDVLEVGDTLDVDAETPQLVCRRVAVGLPPDAVALVYEDVTAGRNEDKRRRREAERLLTVADEERRRIALGVHDDIVQQLAAAALSVEGLSAHAGPDSARDRLEVVAGILRGAQRSLRDLLFDLSPPELAEGGLRSAIEAAVDYLFSRSDAAVGVDVEVPSALPRVVETAAYRIAAEALSNAAKHADAHAVVVQVSQAGQDLLVRVVDDGRGLRVGDDAALQPGHIGLWGMRQRAASVGGTLAIASTSSGTSVTARLPLAPEGQGPPVDRLLLAPDDAESLRAERDGLARAFELCRQRERAAGERAERALAMAGIDDASVVSGIVANGLADSCAVMAGSAVLEAAASGPGSQPGERLVRDDWLELAGIVASTGTPMLVNGPASTATAMGVDAYGVIVRVPWAERPAALVVERARSPYGQADVAFFAALARRIAAAGAPG